MISLHFTQAETSSFIYQLTFHLFKDLQIPTQTFFFLNKSLENIYFLVGFTSLQDSKICIKANAIKMEIISVFFVI